MDYLLNGLIRFKYLIVAFLLASCVFLWPGMQEAIKLDNSLSVWFLEDDPAIVAYQEYKERFGNDESIILLVKDSKGILTQDYFKSFIDLTKLIDAIPEVEGVLGPGNIQVPSKSLMGLTTKSLIDTNSNPEQIERELQQYPEINDQFFTQDYQAARFVIVFKPLDDFDVHRDRVIKEVREVVDQQFPRQNAYMGGVGVIFSGLNGLSQQDFGFFLGIGYLLMFGLLFFFFRSWSVLLYALTTVSSAIYICLGVYGTMGFQLNLMTVLIPSILILLGVLDVVHIINEHKSIAQTEDSPIVKHTLKAVFKPCLYTTLTTMVGFLSLLSSPMAILQNFGIFTALGIFLCFSLSFFFGLLFLPFIKSSNSIYFPKQVLHRFHNHILHHKSAYSGFVIVAIVVAITGSTFIKNDTYTLGYFPKNHRVVTDHNMIEKTWGSYMPFELMIEPQNNFLIKSPQLVSAAQQFSKEVKNMKGIGSSFGFHDLYYAGLKNKFGRRADTLLMRNYGLSQIDRNLKLSYPQLRDYYINDSTGAGRITVYGSMSSAVMLKEKEHEIIQTGEAVFNETATVTPAGYLPMYSEIVRYAAQSQVYSLLLSFLFVFLLVWLFIKSFKLALLAIIPNLFPVLFLFGFMGWFHIDLDIATASIAAIVLSFCIDDTIHYMYRYRKLKLNANTTQEAISRTLDHVGVVIVLTSFILLVGYSVMLFASLKTVYLFGLLTSVAILCAVFSHLVLLPMLLNKFDK